MICDTRLVTLQVILNKRIAELTDTVDTVEVSLSTCRPLFLPSFPARQTLAHHLACSYLARPPHTLTLHLQATIPPLKELVDKQEAEIEQLRRTTHRQNAQLDRYRRDELEAKGKVWARIYVRVFP